MNESTLKNKAYKYIKDKIVSCEYEPGYFLDEKQLIQELNASRTPIREALNKIEQENLIQIIPKKGVVVSQITLKNILDVYQLREVIEPMALSLYGQNLDRARLLYFRNAFEMENPTPMDAEYNLDEDFHSFITSCYNNEYITKLMEEIRAQNQRIRVMAGKMSNCLPTSKNEHREIIDSLLEKDYMRAHHALKEHILASKNRTLEVFM